MTTENNAPKHKVTVLSIDGGGIRGIVPAGVLAEIERRTGKPIAALFDLMAGTSTGGILVLGLAKPAPGSPRPAHTAQELVDFYQQLGSSIFSRPLLYRLASADGLIRSRYPDAPVERVLSSLFGDVRLREAVTPVFIPSYDLHLKTPFFFRSAMAGKMQDYDFPMRDVARSTSAAPSYFSPKMLESKESGSRYFLIDGGVYANNPALCAYVEAKVQFPAAREITVVSLGTGIAANSHTEAKPQDRGMAQWARPILDTVLNGVSSTVDYQLAQLLPKRDDGTSRYYRIQPFVSSRHEAMDDARSENLRALKAAAADTIRTNSAQIDSLCKELVS